MKNVNSDVAYEYIRKRILSGEYPPGHALMTGLLAPEIGVSRTPVRDALRKLETDGLVTIRAHLGASVKKPDLTEYHEMCDLRLALESHAAGKAALNHTEDDLYEIKYALEEMRRLTESVIAAEQKPPLVNELKREDARFHVAIMTASKNGLMKKEILRLHLINRILSGSAGSENAAENLDEARRRFVLASHEAIYAAIASSDAAAAKSAMELHLQDMIDHTLRSMTRSASGVAARELSAEELAYNS